MCKKTIVIFAKSIKHGKYCVAGKDISSKEWIRVVSSTQGAELSSEQTKCTNPTQQSNGKNPYHSKLLYKIEIEFLYHSPLSNQPENYVVSNNVWQHKYAIQPSEIKSYLDTPESLWGDEDKVEFSQIQNGNVNISQSLYLIEVSELKLFKNDHDKRRASFSYQGIEYELPVTDPNFDSILQEGALNLKNILCVSLGEEFNGFCYKIIAAIY